MKDLPLTLRQLQYAVAVHETGGFRRAAERCHVSQPSLSAQLAQLERSLGVRLFERGKGRVLVTPAGDAVLARARQVLLAADDLLDAAGRLQDPLVGTVRFGVIPTVAPYLLPEVVPTLRTRFPRTTFAWREDKTDALVREVREGQLDAAVLALEADTGGLAHELIAQDPFVLAAAKDHPLARRRGPLRLEDLQGHEVLLLDDGHCLRDQALSLCTRADAREAALRATSLVTLSQMVMGGAGVTLLPSLAVALENRRGELHIRRFQRPAPKRTLALVFREASPLARSLVDVVKALQQAYPSASSPMA